MSHPFGFWSLVPPVLAIVLAMATRQVYLSLMAGIWIGYVVLEGAVLDGSLAAVDACVNVFADAGNTRVILFSILVGSLIALMQRNGGVAGFTNWVVGRKWVRGPRSAGLLAAAVGMCVFVESSISSLVTGTIGRPLFDRQHLSREKLAYVCDTCSAPTCMLIPLNGWGAFVLAQLTLLGVEDPLATLLRSIPLNFYALASLALLGLSVALNIDVGPMRTAQQRARREGKPLRDGAQPMIGDEITDLGPLDQTPRRAINMVLPVAWMVLMVPVGLFYSGTTALPQGTSKTFWNVLRASSGSQSVLWSVLTAVLLAILLCRVQNLMTLSECVEVVLKGAGALLPLGLLMMLAFAIGQLCGNEGLATGSFVASVVGDGVRPTVVAPVLFAIAGLIAFSTGTSWGTFAIMLSIAVPLANSLKLDLPLIVAAVLGGGVFGDHCSPISDTTVVSSMASASDHIDHVRTQLPYALAAAVLALALYVGAGYL